MKVAIHQPHYFPWLGYFDKMAKVDGFILMDEVQLTRQSNMFRNKFVNKYGAENLLTVSFQRKGFMEKQFQEVLLNLQVDWQAEHKKFMMENYGKYPYFTEVWEKIAPIFEKKYIFMCEVAIDSLMVIKDMLDIPTKLILQSDLEYDKRAQKNELILALCEASGAIQYLSGNGARKYMMLESFAERGIHVEYQSFVHPVYPQYKIPEFVPCLSSLDLLFNCGIEESRRIFWENVRKTNEFGESSL